MATFDAIKGSAIANSYATTDEADDYFEFEFNAEDWEQISDDDKEKLLVTATRLIDRLRVDYPKADAPQALKFPISGYVDDSGIADDGFESAKEACILEALFLYRNSETIAEALNARISGTKSESLGKVSKSTKGYNTLAEYDPRVFGRLSPFVRLSVNLRRA